MRQYATPRLLLVRQLWYLTCSAVEDSSTVLHPLVQQCGPACSAQWRVSTGLGLKRHICPVRQYGMKRHSYQVRRCGRSTPMQVGRVSYPALPHCKLLEKLVATQSTPLQVGRVSHPALTHCMLLEKLVATLHTKEGGEGITPCTATLQVARKTRGNTAHPCRWRGYHTLPLTHCKLFEKLVATLHSHAGGRVSHPALPHCKFLEKLVATLHTHADVEDITPLLPQCKLLDKVVATLNTHVGGEGITFQLPNSKLMARHCRRCHGSPKLACCQKLGL
jgi:hypothetical protein